MLTEKKGSAEELARLRRERDDADRRYNDALTKLDMAIGKLGEPLPDPPPGYDEFQVTPLNERWELLKLKPDEGSGWLKRVRAHAWAMVAPLFERQQAFNSALVDHVNRNVATHRKTAGALGSTMAMVADDHRRFIEYQTFLILYLQQITPYVDTKDRQVAGLMHGLAAGLSALGDEFQKRWEWMVAHERRYENQVNDVRTTLSVMQRAVQTMKRELQAVLSATGETGPTGAASADASLDSYKYVGFEDQFRGSEHDIRERLTAYVTLFEGASDVLDVGCGRGEFLALLRERGITAHGVDVNDEMVAVCRERGLDAKASDALSYLNSLADGSLGGLFAAQVVEHLEPNYLMRFLETAYHKLRPGSRIVLETINPACWFAFFSSYIRDITHQRPLHPDTLQYLVRASGFQNVTVRYSAPYPNESKLQRVAAEEAESPAQAAMATVVNDNVTKLNSLLFTHLDYAAIGERM
jgi:2-polyprenyl-3-methyl-5-hydroxy-6-metoxy-1,4-benzoquinol methylase